MAEYPCLDPRSLLGTEPERQGHQGPETSKGRHGGLVPGQVWPIWKMKGSRALTHPARQRGWLRITVRKPWDPQRPNHPDASSRWKTPPCPSRTRKLRHRAAQRNRAMAGSRVVHSRAPRRPETEAVPIPLHLTSRPEREPRKGGVPLLTSSCPATMSHLSTQ